MDRADAGDPDHSDFVDRLGAGMEGLGGPAASAAALRRRWAPPTLPPSAYAGALQSGLAAGASACRSCAIQTDGKPLIAGSRRKPSEGRPTRTQVWIDPRDASIVDRAPGNSGIIQVMHDLHGSLMVPGWGRTIVGWVGVFMFVSCLTGIWLWWPLSGGFRSGLRWRRQQHDQRQPPLPNGLLGPVPARHAVVHRGLDQFPERVRQVRKPAARRRRTASAPPAPSRSPRPGSDVDAARGGGRSLMRGDG